MRSTLSSLFLTRSLPLAFVLGAALVLGAGLLPTTPAHGEDGDEAAKASDLKVLRGQVEALQHQVAYLRSREADLSAYILANDVRAASLQQALKQAQTQGFLNRSIPADSRTTLLQGLGDLARSMRAELPQMTSEQKRLQKEADRASARAARDP